MSVITDEADPITAATADLVPSTGTVSDLRKELQCLTAALAERKKYKKTVTKQIGEQIKDVEDQIEDVITQLEGLEKTL